MQKFILATAIPIALIASLFFVVQKSRIKTFHFEREYHGRLFDEADVVNNNGLYQVQEHKGRLYGTDFRAIYAVDFPSFKKRAISEVESQPVVGWGFHNDTILVGLANTKTIFYLDASGTYVPYKKFDFSIERIFVPNDSIILLKTYDTSFLNNEFYSYNLNSKRTDKLNDHLPKYNDGGFSVDGEFIDGNESFVHLQFNMGKFTVVDKRSMVFSDNFSTIDHNALPPPVIHFAAAGFRLDKKYSKTNIAAFTRGDKLYVFSNAYNNLEYYGGSFKYEYPVDVYDLKDGQYKSSFSVSRNTITNGSLVTVAPFENYIILIFLRKIAIAKL